ncbi:MAG: hypothetical protein IKI90_07510 [Treponema sp.]|nr:hypothetical protein [Treponema sp.]MBR4005682.1 hypothetical protein [Treponema sp.]
MKDSKFIGKRLFKTAFTLAIVLTAFLAASCTSIPDTVPDDPHQIIQLAQNATDQGNTKLARYYYEQLLEKHGNEADIYIEANYELAHLDIKKKNYDDAVPRLDQILYIYNNVAPGVLPGKFKKLAAIDLAKVPEAEVTRIRAEKAASQEVQQ